MYTIYYIHEDQPEHALGVSSQFMPDCLEDAGDCHEHGVQWYILDSQGRTVCESEDVS